MDRLIPASGETTTRRRRIVCTRTAHPRERGDDSGDTLWGIAARGSSPRAGRRPHAADPLQPLQGLIPASGETTPRSFRGHPSSEAHPRERGDDPERSASGSTHWGSSPRAGRRRVARDRGRDARGLIPASGETTSSGSWAPTSRSAHPRERGDDHDQPKVQVRGTGSSPRAGRRLEGMLAAADEAGLIPASGETTSCSSGSRAGRRAHPRERGDDAGFSSARSDHAGSSPRAGRRRSRLRCSSTPRGLIPASGETTGVLVLVRPCLCAHPRERGDDRLGLLDEVVPQGSSPRAGRRPSR